MDANFAFSIRYKRHLENIKMKKNDNENTIDIKEDIVQKPIKKEQLDAQLKKEDPVKENQLNVEPLEKTPVKENSVKEEHADENIVVPSKVKEIEYRIKLQNYQKKILKKQQSRARRRALKRKKRK